MLFIRKVGVFCLYMFLLLLLYHSYGWYFKQFANTTLEQILAHLNFQRLLIDRGLKTSYSIEVFKSLLCAILITGILCMILNVRWLDRYWVNGKNILSVMNQVTFSKVLLVYLITILLFIYKVEGCGYFLGAFDKERLSNLYVKYNQQDDEVVSIKKNLILIYVESLESGLVRVNDRNLLPFLVSQKGHYVENLKQAPGTNWSMAGMLSSQCSLPFSIQSWNSQLRKRPLDYSLSSFNCLGDILHQHHYKQVFLVGCEINFDGMYDFYSSHHYDRIIGVELLRKSKNHNHNYTSWSESLSDEDLFKEAYAQIKDLSAKKQAYNLTIKTIDSHGPNGHPSPSCAINESNSSLFQVYSCVDRLLQAFITKLRNENLLNNTVVVVMGDHLLMIDDEDRRKMGLNDNVFFKIIGDNLPHQHRNYMTHFDVLPTIMNLLGYRKIGNTNLGFGKSIYNNDSQEEYMQHFQQVMDKSIIKYTMN